MNSEPTILGARLTIGLKRIFGPLATLAGLVRSAFVLEQDIDAMRFRSKYVAALENGDYCQVSFENTDPADDEVDLDGPDRPIY